MFLNIYYYIIALESLHQDLLHYLLAYYLSFMKFVNGGQVLNINCLFLSCVLCPALSAPTQTILV